MCSSYWLPILYKSCLLIHFPLAKLGRMTIRVNGLLYGRPEFESRLGTPEEALYRAETMRITRVVPCE
jgi:hypothetical protein